jgi:hypothetical protein
MSDVWPKYYLPSNPGKGDIPNYACATSETSMVRMVWVEGGREYELGKWYPDEFRGQAGLWQEVTEAEAWAVLEPASSSSLPPRIHSPVPSSDVTLLRKALDGERGDDQKRIADIGLKVVATLLRKNRDYGGSAHKRPVLVPTLAPRQAILVRMSDKVHRIITLLGAADASRSPHGLSESSIASGPPEVQESLEDSFTDLIGYSMLWLTCPEEEGVSAP